MPDPVEQYAVDVISGKEVAGPLVRLACQRHLDDLEQGESRGLWWDWPAAERVFEYFHEVLRLSAGEFEGKPFILAPPQQFIVGSLFGWKNASGYRRFRTAYVEMGKGNAKSPLAAGIGLYMMGPDKEPRAEIYAAAFNRDQAKVPFHYAVAMVEQSPELSARITKSGGRDGDIKKVWNLAHIESGSFFRPISSENLGRGKSGFLPHCVILDELHEHRSDAMVEFMKKNFKSRRQPLALMITNSGVFDTTSVCWRYHQYSEGVLTGMADRNDELFAYVCALDKGDSWTDPAVWKKANPMLNISIPATELEKEVRESLGMPSKQSLTRRLNFCEWVESSDPFIEPEIWRANAARPDETKLRGRTCYGGLDLSSKNDLTALVLVFEPDASGTKDVLSFFWTPKDGLPQRQEHDQAPYSEWVKQKYLIAKDGKTIDYAWVAKKIGELSSLYRIKSIGFDRWRIDDLKKELDEQGIHVTLVPHGQGYKDMSPAVEVLEDDLKEHRLRHGKHPVLTYCIANTRIRSDENNNRKFDKRGVKGHIDGAVALAMADHLSESGKEPEYKVLFV